MNITRQFVRPLKDRYQATSSVINFFNHFGRNLMMHYVQFGYYFSQNYSHVFDRRKNCVVT